MAAPAQIYWFTGLSGSGKTTVGNAVRGLLEAGGLAVDTLDGDDVRSRLHKHLGFSRPEIEENNRLISELCAADRDQFDVILVPIISPFRVSRQRAREHLQPGFHEVYFSADLDAVRQRDSKNLYARADQGLIPDMIGVADHVPYEPPESPDMVIDSSRETPEESCRRLHEFIRDAET